MAAAKRKLLAPGGGALHRAFLIEVEEPRAEPHLARVNFPFLLLGVVLKNPKEPRKGDKPGHVRGLGKIPGLCRLLYPGSLLILTLQSGSTDGLQGKQQQHSIIISLRQDPIYSAATMDAAEYARHNDLTVDSLLEAWLGPFDADDAITSTLDPAPSEGLFELDGLEECLFRTIIPGPEQLQMTVGSLKLLQYVHMRSKEQDLTDCKTGICFTETTERSKLKFELPVLRSDHETDCRHLALEVGEFQKPRLTDHNIPLHPVDESSGEGIEFSESAKKGDMKVMNDIGKENMEMKRETLGYLVECLKTHWTEEDQRNFIGSVSTYQGVRAVPSFPHNPPDQEGTNAEAGQMGRTNNPTPESTNPRNSRILCAP